MAFLTRVQDYRWDRLTGWVDLAAAALCLVPTVGFLLAWHMQADLVAFTLFVTLPALLALGACEVWMAHRSPLLFNRFSSGLLGGLLATAALDAIRLPAGYLLKGAPDYVPLIGQHLTGEMIGIAPTAAAIGLGYGYHYLLIGALLGAAYSLVSGRGRWQWSLAAGLIAGATVAMLPQFQMLTMAKGFTLGWAQVVVVAGFGLAGTLLGLVVQRLGRTTANVLQVVFLREAPVEQMGPAKPGAAELIER